MQLKEQLAGARKILAETGMIELPKEVLELQELFERHDVPNFADITKIIGQNAILAGEVVQTANLPSMQGSLYRDVLSIPDAIDILGVVRLRNLVKAIALKRTLDGFGLDEITNHSVEVASLAAKIAKQTGLIASDEAYLLGLFHNLGAIMMAKHDAGYLEVFTKSLTAPFSSVSLELAKYQTSHGVVGLLVAESWQLEDIFKKVIITHYEKNLSVIRNPQLKAMVALIQLCNAIVAERHFDVYVTPELQEMGINSVIALGIDEADISEIWQLAN